MHRKDRLVYADLIEHLILHAIIAKETDGRFGEKGYSVFLAPNVDQWFISKKMPDSEWMKAVYRRSFLTKEEAKRLLEQIDSGPRAKVARYYRI